MNLDITTPLSCLQLGTGSVISLEQLPTNHIIWDRFIFYGLASNQMLCKVPVQ